MQQGRVVIIACQTNFYKHTTKEINKQTTKQHYCSGCSFGHAPPVCHTWHCIDLVDILQHFGHGHRLLAIRIELLEHHHGRPSHCLLEFGLRGELPHLHFILGGDACEGSNTWTSCSTEAPDMPSDWVTGPVHTANNTAHRFVFYCMLLSHK